MTKGFFEVDAPKGWRQVRVKNITTYVNRGVAPSYSDDPTDVLVFNQKCLRPDRSIDLSLGKFQDVVAGPQWRRARLQAGDVLVNSTGTGTLGRAGLFRGADVEVMADGHVTILRPDAAEVEPRFLAYALGTATFYRYANEALAVGATNQTELNRERLRAIAMVVPDLPRQRGVADLLDAELGRMDDLLGEQARQLGLLDEHEAALVNARIWSDATSEQPLYAVVDPSRPCTYGVVLNGPHVEDGVPVVEAGTVAGGRLLDFPELRRTMVEIEAPYKRSRIIPGDLVMAIRGSVGAVDLVPAGFPQPANLTRDAARIAPNSQRVDAMWLMLALRSSRVQGQIKQLSLGSAVGGLNIWSLDRLRVPDVPQSTQLDALAALLPALKRIEELRHELRGQQLLLREHRDALVTAAVTGQLNPEEES